MKMKKKNDPMFDGSVHISIGRPTLRGPKISDEEFQAALEEHWDEKPGPKFCWKEFGKKVLCYLFILVMAAIAFWEWQWLSPERLS